VKILAADVVNDPLSGAYHAAVLIVSLQVLSPKDALRVVQNIAAVLNPGTGSSSLARFSTTRVDLPWRRSGFNLTFIKCLSFRRVLHLSAHRGWLTAAGFVDIDPSLLPDEVV